MPTRNGVDRDSYLAAAADGYLGEGPDTGDPGRRAGRLLQDRGVQDSSRDQLTGHIAQALTLRLDEIVASMAPTPSRRRPTCQRPRQPAVCAPKGETLPEILRAYRLSFSLFWDELRAEAHHAGTEAMSALLHTTPRAWALSDSYSSALTDSYRETVAERLVETDRRRSALVAALTDGPLSGGDTIWEVARMLKFPYQGKFLVVVAETLKVGEPPLPGLEAKLRALDVRSAWRAQPGHEIGVLSCPRRQPVGQLVDAIGVITTGRTGVSPAYEQLDQTSRALRYAQVALESLCPGPAAVRQLDDTPLTELVMNNLETTRRAVYRVLGGVLSLPEEDRSTLPKIVAELTMALAAVGTFPDLLRQRHLLDATGSQPEATTGAPLS
ncbi:PucR family transcriptional regulator [Streptomyces sp. NPDC048442]|uniref:PucR family transcriptional regulator n=1 Tax=Streptomyces sp. NPDC048442 TaxID=3154823 RepID=UPI003431848D